MVISLLFDSFANGRVLKDSNARHAKFAPWYWNDNDAELAKTVEEKFKALGVREDLCTAKSGLEDENTLSASI